MDATKEIIVNKSRGELRPIKGYCRQSTKNGNLILRRGRLIDWGKLNDKLIADQRATANSLHIITITELKKKTKRSCLST